MTHQEEKIWNQLMDFYEKNEFSFGSEKLVSIKSTQANKKVLIELSKWADPFYNIKEYKDEYKEFLNGLITNHDGFFKVSEHLLWSYLINEQN